MEKIDTSDWSIVEILVGDVLITHRTLQSEAWERSFCERNEFKLISFRKGTNPLCA